MVNKINNWYRKIKGEYLKSGMNVFMFIYWTLHSDYDEIKRKRARAIK